MNLADGSHSLLDIADRAGMTFSVIRDAACQLLDHDLLTVDDEAARE
jgi:aminopeptidase-like protein